MLKLPTHSGFHDLFLNYNIASLHDQLADLRMNIVVYNLSHISFILLNIFHIAMQWHTHTHTHMYIYTFVYRDNNLIKEKVEKQKLIFCNTWFNRAITSRQGITLF